MKRRASTTSESVAKYYDELVHVYRGQETRHVHRGLWIRGDETRAGAKQNLASRVADQLGLAPGDRCVDVGCSYGDMARYLSASKRITVTAVTSSALQYSRAGQENRAEGVVYRFGDWSKNDLNGAAYNAAWAVESMAHMPDLAGAPRQPVRHDVQNCKLHKRGITEYKHTFQHAHSRLRTDPLGIGTIEPPPQRLLTRTASQSTRILE